MVILSDDPRPNVQCTVFEDNKGCINSVLAPMIRHITKHITLKHHHFRSYVKKQLISIHNINTKMQISDIFTKSLKDTQFSKLLYIVNT